MPMQNVDIGRRTPAREPSKSPESKLQHVKKVFDLKNSAALIGAITLATHCIPNQNTMSDILDPNTLITIHQEYVDKLIRLADEAQVNIPALIRDLSEKLSPDDPILLELQQKKAKTDAFFENLMQAMPEFQTLSVFTKLEATESRSQVAGGRSRLSAPCPLHPNHEAQVRITRERMASIRACWATEMPKPPENIRRSEPRRRGASCGEYRTKRQELLWRVTLG
jgi:hypothetical protein